ncbi:MAG TPA: O-antigen ligase family protein [Pyrinomonadaceae bacterium]|nr:O-antigen ligase family protein [Pyrinomonadaceae bacterium]
MDNSYRELDYEPVTRKPRACADEADDAKWPHRVDAWADENAPREKTTQMPVSHSAPAAGSEGKVLRRGHVFSFIGLVLFTIVMYLRPYQYSEALIHIQFPLIIAVATLAIFIPAQLGLEGTLTTRPREVNLLLLLLLMSLLSIPLGYDPEASFQSFKDFSKFAIIFIILVNVVRTERRLRQMLHLALSIAFILCVIALSDYHQGNLTIEGYRVRGGIARGFFEDPNDLASYLVTMMPIAFALGLGARGGIRKIIYGACVLLCLSTIIITFSRGGFLGLMAVTMTLVWKFGRRQRFTACAVAAFALLLLAILAPGNYWMRLASIFIPGLDTLGSAAARSQLLKQSIIVSLRHPLLGIGMGNFKNVSMGDHVTHNAYTQVSAETGMIALAAYVMFIVAPLKRLRGIEEELFDDAKRERRFYYLAIGLQASLVGYMVSSFFISVAYYPMIYYLVGYAICFRRIYESAKAEKNLIAKKSLGSASLVQSS